MRLAGRMCVLKPLPIAATSVYLRAFSQFFRTSTATYESHTNATKQTAFAATAIVVVVAYSARCLFDSYELHQQTSPEWIACALKLLAAHTVGVVADFACNINCNLPNRLTLSTQSASQSVKSATTNNK